MVNRNSFATYLGLCTLAALCWILMQFERIKLVGYWRDKLQFAIRFVSARAWLLVCTFLIITALLLTHSRGGFLSTMFGALSLVLTARQTASRKGRRHLGWVAAPIVIVLIAGLISGTGILARLMATDIDSEERLKVFALTWQAIRDYPYFGTGLGSFAAVFPIYRTTAITTSLTYDMAHNDYLQNLLELGIPAAACLFMAVLWLVGLCVRGMRERRRDALFPCLGIAASVLVGIHATVDFSLQIPAVTITYMFLLGLAVAQSKSSRSSRERRAN